MAGRPTGFTDEELAMLTDEEREGLLEDDGDDDTDDDTDDDDLAGADDPGADAASQSGEDKGDKPERQTGRAGKAPEGETEEEKAARWAREDVEEAEQIARENAADAAPSDEDAVADATSDDKQKPQKLRSALPEYDVPADVDDQIKTLRDQRKDLAKKFDDGDLTAAEFHEQTDTLIDKIDDLRDLKRSAKISHDSRVHAFTSEAVPAFLEAHPEYVEGSLRYRTLDRELRALQEAAMAEGGDGLDPSLIEKAHAQIQSEFQPQSKKPTPAKDGQQRELPPTLGGVPAAAEADFGDGGKFAAIDRLDGVEYENALAKLSETERDQYLARA